VIKIAASALGAVTSEDKMTLRLVISNLTQTTTIEKTVSTILLIS
jgi:hypothetical protein